MPELADPCAEAAALRDARRDLAMGATAAEVRFGMDTVKYSQSDMGVLDRLISEAEAKCRELNGEKNVRRRWAMGARHRPY